MIYQQSIVFNELSVNEKNSEQIDYILNNFYELIFKLINLSGKKLKNPDKNNLDRILFYEEFDRNFLISTNQFDDIERRRLKKLFSNFDMPSVPEYRFQGEEDECKGLGYACENNLLGISLHTNSKWENTALEIQKIENDDNLTETTHKVRNISTVDNVFEILEEFAQKFYENCYYKPIFFEADRKDKKSKNFTHNLLPLKDISNLYIECIGLYETSDNQVKTTFGVTEKRKVCNIVAQINGWQKCSKKGRTVYKHNETTYLLSEDTKKCDFEIYDAKGSHLGAISLDCQKQESCKDNRKVMPC